MIMIIVHAGTHIQDVRVRLVLAGLREEEISSLFRVWDLLRGRRRGHYNVMQVDNGR